jgi:hypothetical protein
MEGLSKSSDFGKGTAPDSIADIVGGEEGEDEDEEDARPSIATWGRRIFILRLAGVQSV